jgi:predicted dehydrogenase
MNILVTGAGYMAKEYAKVLTGLGVTFEVVGRSSSGVAAFRESFPGIPVHEGGLENFNPGGRFTHAIVASNIESLYSNSVFLIEKGIRHLLLEKPGGVSSEQIELLNTFAAEKNARVIIAYNRRYYASVITAEKMIAEDGGLTSFNFEFTEWAHTIEPLAMNEDVKQHWFLANSSHVADTAFFLGGPPRELTCFHSGSLNWHKRSAVFAGAGIAEGGALFSYQANWKAPGRWSVEMLTQKRRYIFRPMEKLHIQQIGSVAVEPYAIDDSLDTAYKPGLYLQTKAFIDNNDSRNCLLQDHNRIVQHFYNRIAGY